MTVRNLIRCRGCQAVVSAAAAACPGCVRCLNCGRLRSARLDNCPACDAPYCDCCGRCPGCCEARYSHLGPCECGYPDDDAQMQEVLRATGLDVPGDLPSSAGCARYLILFVVFSNGIFWCLC